ncbi:hypothetical protein K469DRAFT_700102 [Zopfia rhizophila CBS 207.26]|uniref:Ribosomal protein bL31m N-terminal domain-containing protein n=1 Tax=Zopfia rhizophila CBS 207.26 TaxID=1314779 RepID=A0A6A6DFM1_9PEZI|nr:hypothetical protein K469DRAFT_700102 [Zopfia rhizophila CBS 207.26]
MPTPIPSSGVLRLLRRAIEPQIRQNNHQVRHATLLRRPKRPYTFTQLVTLSDGSTFLHRTTSPIAVYKSTKDMRNTPLWNPSSQKLLNVEEDEAGKLRAFRAKFGRGWDAENTIEIHNAEAADGKSTDQPTDHLLDLISGYRKGAGEKTPAENSKWSTSSPAKSKPGKK